MFFEMAGHFEKYPEGPGDAVAWEGCSAGYLQHSLNNFTGTFLDWGGTVFRISDTFIPSAMSLKNSPSH